MRVFLASGWLPGVSGSDLGSPREPHGASFGRPWRSPGASGSLYRKLGEALGAPGVPREGLQSHFGSILRAPACPPATIFGRFRYRFSFPEASLPHTICLAVWKV